MFNTEQEWSVFVWSKADGCWPFRWTGSMTSWLGPYQFRHFQILSLRGSSIWRTENWSDIRWLKLSAMVIYIFWWPAWSYNIDWSSLRLFRIYWCHQQIRSGTSTLLSFSHHGPIYRVSIFNFHFPFSSCLSVFIFFISQWKCDQIPCWDGVCSIPTKLLPSLPILSIACWGSAIHRNGFPNAIAVLW